jgi:hypothetical protein
VAAWAAPPPPRPLPSPPPPQQQQRQQRQQQQSLANELASALAALAKLEAQTTCVVCLDAPRSTLLWPCRHLLLCGDAACAAMLGAPARLCPVCREPVAQLLPVFM